MTVFDEKHKEAIRIGMQKAKANGLHIGRPPLPLKRRCAIQKMHKNGRSYREIKQLTGLSLATICKYCKR